MATSTSRLKARDLLHLGLTAAALFICEMDVCRWRSFGLIIAVELFDDRFTYRLQSPINTARSLVSSGLSSELSLSV